MLVIAVIAGGIVADAADRGAQRATANATVVTARSSAAGRQIPAGFVGLSLEIRGIETFTGTDPHNVNPVLEQLIRNLAPGQRPEIRLGGDTTDWSWYPIRGRARPLGVRYSLSKQWLAVVKSFAAAINARMIFGINFEVDSASVAAAEARAIVSGIGAPWLEALALGNEPELYSSQTWFALHGRKYYGRPRSYNFGAYLNDYAAIVRALPRVTLAGPDVGSPSFIAGLGQFLQSEPRVRIATLHRYPLVQCQTAPKVTIAELLSPASTSGLADGLAASVGVAASHGVPLRLDETNSVSCGGEPGVSNSFASALWSLDAMFELARVGIQGVNVHSKLGTSNALWVFSQAGGRWRAAVEPDYYGLLAFAQAAPAGSRLVRVPGSGSWPVHVWATLGPDRKLRFALINFDTHASHEVVVRAPGTSGGLLERLSAPSAAATGHVTLGGQSFGSSTTTGLLAGTPHETQLRSSGGSYRVTLPAASAAILTL
jgi:hypothetical protein